MQIQLNAFGNIPASAPKTFFRVETWQGGRRVADFTTQVEAENVARASNHGGRFDHKVVQLFISGR